MNVEELEERIKKIEARNKTVEANKAWEISYTRRGMKLGHSAKSSSMHGGSCASLSALTATM